jgi:hypothetical protein
MSSVSMRLAVIALGLAGLSACSYAVAPTPAAAVNIYTSFPEQIPGRWLLVIDEGARQVKRTVKPSSHECRAHKYPMDVGASVTESLKSTIDAVFDEVVVRTSMSSDEALRAENIAGSILVRLENFQPRASCQFGLFSFPCTASTDLSFGVSVRGPSGQLFGGTAGSTKTADGSAGGACGKISDLLAQSFENAEREALERLAEKLSNSDRIRASVAPARTPQ